MAENTTPNRAASTDKAEGDRSNPEANYDRTSGEGGITNRPLDEEIESQEAVPDRGNRKSEER